LDNPSVTPGRCRSTQRLLFFYGPDETGLILKTKRSKRFPSKRGSVFVPVSLSLSMMSWIAPQ
jgi:hypothetical protein